MNKLTIYFDDLIRRGLQFREWWFGHYHNRKDFDYKYHMIYQDILRLFSAYLQAFRLHMTPLVMYNTGRMLSFYVET